MLITDAFWKIHRDEFTEGEKEKLREAECGQTICPRGVIIDDALISSELSTKIVELKGVR